MKRVWIYCKNEDCKKLVEKTEKNGYICTHCSESLFEEIKDAPNIQMNPFARQTKMEISYSSHDDAINRLKGTK